MLRDGYLDKVYYRFFEVENPVANVFLIHGLGGHCLWFDEAGKLFNKHSINSFSFDLPGFGQSKYAKGKVDTYKIWINTTRDLLWSFISKYSKGKPLFIIGHSMGALIAMVLAKNVQASGWILTVPGFEGHKKSFPPLQFVLPTILSSIFMPTKKIIVPFGPDRLVKNKDMQCRLKEDPFRVIDQDAKIYLEVYLLGKLAKKLCKSFNEPLLMLQAEEDIVCSNEAMLKYFNLIPSSDKEKIVYQNAYHDLFVEDCLEQVIKDISSWINKQILQKPYH